MKTVLDINVEGCNKVEILMLDHLNNVANIDDIRVGNWLDTDPLTIRLPLNIKPTDIILSQDGEGSAILVPANT